MKNLQELLERYKTTSLGCLSWGGKSYYEINSDVPVSLNSYSTGFILNEDGEVECFDISSRHEQYYLNDKEISKEEYDAAEEGFSSWEEFFDAGYERNNACKKWWGKTLDNYYPHPWFPDKTIVGFEIIRHLPFYNVGEVYESKGNHISSYSSQTYGINECLDYPEFFKPVYE